MKKIFAIAALSIACISVQAQEFNKHLSTARAAYSSRKLDDSRFAMQQMLQELDITIGKEMLKVLPAKILDQNANTAKDNVSGASGFVG